jgi:hypothetical protein
VTQPGRKPTTSKKMDRNPDDYDVVTYRFMLGISGIQGVTTVWVHKQNRLERRIIGTKWYKLPLLDSDQPEETDWQTARKVWTMQSEYIYTQRSLKAEIERITSAKHKLGSLE